MVRRWADASASDEFAAGCGGTCLAGLFFDVVDALDVKEDGQVVGEVVLVFVADDLGAKRLVRVAAYDVVVFYPDDLLSEGDILPYHTSFAT